jgi:hypothetical protein
VAEPLLKGRIGTPAAAIRVPKVWRRSWARTADPDDHIEWIGDLRLGDLLDGGPLPLFVEPDRLHQDQSFSISV